MLLAQIVEMAKSSAFLRHSFTTSASISTKERYFNDPSRYFSSESRYCTFPRSSPIRPARNPPSVSRKPMLSSQ